MKNKLNKKEKVLNNLIIFNYRFIEKDNVIIVNLDFKINVIITFKNNIVIIKNELLPYNLLSGVFKTSIYKFLITTNILSLLLIFSIYIFELFGTELYLFTLAVIIISYFMLAITSIFFIIKYEFFKYQIMSWMND